MWRALTEAEHLIVWFPADIEGDRAAGAKLRFVFRNGDGPPSDGEMLVYDPPSAALYCVSPMWSSGSFRKAHSGFSPARSGGHHRERCGRKSNLVP